MDLYQANEQMDFISNHRNFLDPDETEDVILMEEIMFYKYIDPYHSESEPVLKKYRAYRRTPEGYWIVPNRDHHITWVRNANKKWISRQDGTNTTRRKLFAYQNQDDALYSYYRRKLEHIRHVENKHRMLKRVIRTIEHRQNFFGAQRPIITNFFDHTRGDHILDLEPLEKERPKKEFIEERDFAIL